MLFSYINMFLSTEYYNWIANYGQLIHDTTFGGSYPSQADCHHILPPCGLVLVFTITFSLPHALLEGAYSKQCPPTSMY